MQSRILITTLKENNNFGRVRSTQTQTSFNGFHPLLDVAVTMTSLLMCHLHSRWVHCGDSFANGWGVIPHFFANFSSGADVAHSWQRIKYYNSFVNFHWQVDTCISSHCSFYEHMYLIKDKIDGNAGFAAHKLAINQSFQLTIQHF